MNTLINLISTKNWQAIANQYKQKFLAKKLSFKEGRLLAYKILINDERDDSLREYATELLEEIRQIHAKEWSVDWRNDFFLGDAYFIIMKYAERYASYIRAYNKVNPKPHSLLISLAGCYLSPQPPISIDEAKKMVEQALEQKMCVEGVILLRGIYGTFKDEKNFDYWSKVLEELQRKQIYAKNEWPDLFS